MREHVPAFPTAEPGNPDKWGMDLRDYFAGQALNGWLATYPEDSLEERVDTKVIATFAFQLADAMMEERKK